MKRPQSTAKTVIQGGVVTPGEASAKMTIDPPIQWVRADCPECRGEGCFQNPMAGRKVTCSKCRGLGSVRVDLMSLEVHEAPALLEAEKVEKVVTDSITNEGKKANGS